MNVLVMLYLNKFMVKSKLTLHVCEMQYMSFWGEGLSWSYGG